ncbi:hypothetical protein ACSMDF_16510 [Yersinia enterocolitica]|jgi:hypothetical protein|uniref:ketol-acid reductoisomerase n=1 Tax=Yersinia TaxID=629 RepID=UPI0005DB78FA|nr:MULTISPECIES: ketol-acid reductoisomerase [Yersinia]ATM87287.1 ketol-acid reductoisomerase [Yersinia frederiksenii]MCB5317903.1 hypothetical protein [Yersinia massiliensis]CNL78563.1 Uncharacterised protein [Yersinia frederiksenii]HEC1651226.1 hypothetical protein [Yersinia enterocolitica]
MKKLLNMKLVRKFTVVALFIFSAPAFSLNQETSHFEKALLGPEQIKEAIAYQKEADKNQDVQPREGEKWFDVILGQEPIIISAPHATQPFRDGKYRFSDGGGTAALAIMLGKLTNSTVIFTTKASPSDPNYYDDNDYKVQLAELIKTQKPKLIIDIHGSHPFRPYDVDIGTMNGESLLGKDELLTKLIASLRNEGISNYSNNYFAASKNETITKFGAAHGVPTIQLEFSSVWMVPSDGNYESHRFAQLLQGMVRYVNSVNNAP